MSERIGELEPGGVRTAPNAGSIARRARGAMDRVLPAAVVGAAVAVASVRLGTKSLWHDEAYSWAMARLPASTFWKASIRQESFIALYYLVLRAWSAVGTSEALLRVPSVVFGGLSVWTLVALNRRLFDRRVALVAGLLLAVNVFFLRYEQEARAYTLAACLGLVATYAFVRAVEVPTLGRWAGYGALAALAVYGHAFVAFVLVAHASSLLVCRAPRRSAVVGFVVAAAASAPLLILLARGVDIQRGIARPGIGAIPSAFLDLSGGGARSTATAMLALAYAAPACLALVTVASGFGAHSTAEDRPRDSVWPFVLVFAWLAVPVCCAFALSLVVRRVGPIFTPRYLIVVLPALTTTVALGIARLPTLARRAAVLAIIVASLPALTGYYREPFKNGEDWRGATMDVVDRAEVGDGIVFLARFGRRPFEYYLERLGGGKHLTPIYPPAPWGGYPPVLADQRFSGAAVAAARMDEAFPRVWVVLLWGGFDSPYEDGVAMQRTLLDDYRLEDEHSFGPYLRIALYVRITPSAG